MANIQQAARWMDRDKEVRLASDPLEVFSQSEYFGGAVMMSRCESIGGFARITTKHLLAQDWEIAEK